MEFGGQPRKRYRFCVSVVAMGDHNGRAFAQGSHEEFRSCGGLLQADSVMRYGKRLLEAHCGKASTLTIIDFAYA